LRKFYSFGLISDTNQQCVNFCEIPLITSKINDKPECCSYL